MPFTSLLPNTDSNWLQTSFKVDRNDVKGTLRIIWWPPKDVVSNDEGITSILVFTCGNPGIPEWYIDFLNLIRDENPGVAIAACGHIGHAHDLPTPLQSSLSLPSQVEAHSAVLEGLIELFPNAQFLSVSHSIGAYISLRVARCFPNKVSALVALQPTISNMAQTPNGRVMKAGLSHAKRLQSQLLQYFFMEPIRSVLSILGAFLVQAFPFVLSLLFGHWPKLSIKHLHGFLASSATSHAAMTMGSDEMVLVAELDTPLLVEMREKLHIVYSESGDLWVGNNSDQVVRVLAEPSHIKFAPIPHAFCLNHNTEAAEACLPWIKQALDVHRSH